MAEYKKMWRSIGGSTVMGQTFEAFDNGLTGMEGTVAYEALRAHKTVKATRLDGGVVYIPFHAVSSWSEETISDDVAKADAYCNDTVKVTFWSVEGKEQRQIIDIKYVAIGTNFDDIEKPSWQIVGCPASTPDVAWENSEAEALDGYVITASLDAYAACGK